MIDNEEALQAYADGIEALRKRQDAYLARKEGKRICPETGGACPWAHLDECLGPCAA